MPFGTPIPAEKLTELDANNWELYHVAEDFAENHNIAADNRAKLIEMIAQWYAEAGKYKVLPIDGRGPQRIADERPVIATARTKYTYYPGTQTIPPVAGAIVLNRPHSITANVDYKSGDEGVLFSHGGNVGGYSLFIRDSKLHYVYNYVGQQYFNLESEGKVPVGHHQLRFEFEPTGKPEILKGKGTPGRGQLYFDGELVGQIDISVTIPLLIELGGGLTVGADPGSPVSPEYQPPFAFTGIIHNVTVDVSGDLIRDTDAEMRQIMARQ